LFNDEHQKYYYLFVFGGIILGCRSSKNLGIRLVGQKTQSDIKDGKKNETLKEYYIVKKINESPVKINQIDTTAIMKGISTGLKYNFYNAYYFISKNNFETDSILFNSVTDCLPLSRKRTNLANYFLSVVCSMISKQSRTVKYYLHYMTL